MLITRPFKFIKKLGTKVMLKNKKINKDLIVIQIRFLKYHSIAEPNL